MAENQAQPFDEQAVLQELEQLHHAILVSRKEREHAVAKFDTFVKGFRAPSRKPVSDSHAPDTPLIRGPWVTDAPVGSTVTNVLPEVQPSVVEPVTSMWAPVAEVEPAEPVERSSLGPPPPAVDPIASLRRRLQEQDYTLHVEPVETWRSKTLFAIAAAAAAVAVVALLLYALWGRGPAQQTAPSARQATPAPATDAPESAPSAAPGPVRALRVELTTLRPVWMRVTVDDNRAFERQVPAGERIPLEADRTIAVRAGDAGAVRVTVDGRAAGVLGADGEVVTRAFKPSPSATDRVPR